MANVKIELTGYSQHRHVVHRTGDVNELVPAMNFVTTVHGRLPNGSLVSFTIDAATFDKHILPLFGEHQVPGGLEESGS